MKAALYDHNGPAGEVLRVEEIERPEPGPGEVRVRMQLSGINPTDWKSRAGATPRPIDGFQIPHHDGAGVIDKVGEGVDPGRDGERVWLWLAAASNRWGTAAEWTVLPTVSGPQKAELAARAGADHVVNYRDADAADQVRALGPPVDRVIELALGANLRLDLAVTRPHASIVCYAAEPADPALPVRACMTANLTLRFVLMYGVPAAALGQAAADITTALDDGALTELPVTRFALDDVAAAQRAVEAGTPGKVVIDLT